MIALTRLPSGRRASTIGDDSSMRRPTCETIRSMIRSRWASSRKVASVSSSLPRTLDVQLVVAVDHHLGHRGVAQERLEGPVAEDVVGDLALELGALARAERRVLARSAPRRRSRDTRRASSSLPSRLRKALPSRAMHVRWIFVFSSACGSSSVHGPCRGRPAGARRAPTRRWSGTRPLRSMRFIVDLQMEPALRRLPVVIGLHREDVGGQRRQRRARIALLVGEDDRHRAVHGGRDGGVVGQLVRDLRCRAHARCRSG